MLSLLLRSDRVPLTLDTTEGGRNTGQSEGIGRVLKKERGILHDPSPIKEIPSPMWLSPADRLIIISITGG